MKKSFSPVSIIGLVFSLTLLGGCGFDPFNQERGQLTGFQSLDQQAPENLHTYVDNLDTAATDPWQNFWDTVTAYFKYHVSAYKITYYTESASEGTIQVSGLLVMPWKLCGGPVNVPILSLQHPTQVERKYSPSNIKILDPELTVPVALAIASTGYIVVAADYPGMGIDYGVHPYCQESIALSVIDMIRAGRDAKKLAWMNTTWNNQLFLMGYSEGGYVTMVTARELQENHADEFTVTAVAPLDGPYSLSGTMRDVMLDADASYSAPYFLPYTLKGYGAIYGYQTTDFDFQTAVKTSVPDYTPPPESNYARVLYNLLQGSVSGTDIDNFIELAKPYIGPKSILTDSFITKLKDTSSTVCKILGENDAYLDFIPNMPVKMFHCVYDDLVPVGNAQIAYAAFQKAGATNVEYEPYEEYIHGLGSIHAGACPIAYYKGFMWLDAIAYPERHK
jgi:pimeloyl-ACP methyl ester carboxylesterase